MVTVPSAKHHHPLGRIINSGEAKPATLGTGKISIDNSFPNSYELSFHSSINGLELAWRDLEKRSNISIYQRYDWIRNCLETIGDEPGRQTVIVTGHQNSRLVLVLPLTVNQGWIKKIGWIGGSHSNFKMPLIDREFAKQISETDIHRIFYETRQMLGGFGCFTLCCMPKAWMGQQNPMMALTHQESTNLAFGVDLSGGFENVLKQGNGKRKRKKFRWQTRALKHLGGAELVEAKSRSQALEILSCFHRQKSRRLREQGVKDVFGSPKAHQFLKSIALESHFMEEPLLKLFALKIDGEYRAICGGGELNGHFSAYFISFADDELAHISPGEMLIYMLIKNLADSGYQSMDMGCGDERYKQSWCPETIEMVDSILPLSKLSTGYVMLYRAALELRRRLRQNSYAWKQFKRMRAWLSRLYYQAH